MNWEILGSISELFAALAVIASLIYVGRQVQDSATQTRINTSSNIASNAQDGWAPIYNSPEHSRIWRKGVTNKEFSFAITDRASKYLDVTGVHPETTAEDEQ